MKIEKSGLQGVNVHGTKRNTISNCQVNHSDGSGVVVINGLLTMNGSGTSIHNNVTGGRSNDYGLETSFYSSSSIHLVSPLTKESVSINNGGGGNYGGDGLIAIVDNEGTIVTTIQEVTEEILLKIAETVKRKTGESNLCLAGGVALTSAENINALQIAEKCRESHTPVNDGT